MSIEHRSAIRRSGTASRLPALVLIGFLVAGSVPVTAAEPSKSAAEWKKTQEEVFQRVAAGQCEAAYQQLTEIIRAQPDFGPAHEQRAWVVLDWLDLRDEFSLVDVPLRRRDIPDPAAALGNIEPPVAARQTLLQDRVQDAYEPPSQIQMARQDLDSARSLMGSDFDGLATEVFLAEFVGNLKRARALIGSRCETGTATPREYLTHSRILLAEGKFHEALKSAEVAWKSPETRAQATSRKVNLLLALNRPEDAAAFLKVWELESPHDPRLVYLRTAFSGDGASILRDFDELVSLMPKEAAFHYGRATRSMQFRKDTDASLADLNRAIEMNPNSLIPLYARSCLRSIRKELQPALDDVTAAIDRNPYFDLSFQLRAKLLLKQGDEESAKRDKLRELWLKRLYVLHAIHKAQPNNVDAALALGEHYVRGRDWKPAANVLSACLELAPRNTGALRERCQVYQALGNSDLALADATAVVDISPAPGNYAMRGDIHASRKDWDAAVADYERARCLDDRLEQTLRQRAAWHSAAGRVDLAKADLERAEKVSQAVFIAP